MKKALLVIGEKKVVKGRSLDPSRNAFMGHLSRRATVDLEISAINYKDVLTNNLPNIKNSKLIILLFFPFQYWNKNIGRRLMTTALDAAQQRNYKIIWLSVWENNKKAIAFHQQFGFIAIGDGTFTLGKSERKYLIMQKK